MPYVATSSPVCLKLSESRSPLPWIASCVVQFKLWRISQRDNLTIAFFYACYQTQDKLEKDRLMKRRFGHIRHNCYYKNLTEPPTTESLSWLDPKRKEFWRTDVEKVLRRDEDKRRAREKVIFHHHGPTFLSLLNHSWKLDNGPRQAFQGRDGASNVMSYRNPCAS